MSILSITNAQPKVNITASVPQEKTTYNTKNKKLRNKHVRFTLPQISEIKIIHYPILSFHEKSQLYYNENDVSRFRYEYYKFKQERVAKNNDNSSNNQCVVQHHQHNTTHDSHATITSFKSKVLNAIIIFMACIRVATYLIYKKVYRETVLCNIKNASSLLFGKKQSSFEPCCYNERASDVIVVYERRLLWAAAAFLVVAADVDVVVGTSVQHGLLRKPEAVTGEFGAQAATTELAEFTVNDSKNPYMHNGPTAEALAFIFISVAIVICWIECCGAGKK